MTKRRLLRWSLILVILAAFAVWLEPTRVVWGWLRGEAFYQGRPTSWWAAEIGRWHFCGKGWWNWREETSESWRLAYKYNAVEDWVDLWHIRPVFPAILNDESRAHSVLADLIEIADPHAAEIARERLSGTKMYDGTIRVYGGVGP